MQVCFFFGLLIQLHPQQLGVLAAEDILLSYRHCMQSRDFFFALKFYIIRKTSLFGEEAGIEWT